MRWFRRRVISSKLSILSIFNLVFLQLLNKFLQNIFNFLPFIAATQLINRIFPSHFLQIKPKFYLQLQIFIIGFQRIFHFYLLQQNKRHTIFLIINDKSSHGDFHFTVVLGFSENFYILGQAVKSIVLGFWGLDGCQQRVGTDAERGLRLEQGKRSLRGGYVGGEVLHWAIYYY